MNDLAQSPIRKELLYLAGMTETVHGWRGRANAPSGSLFATAHTHWSEAAAADAVYFFVYKLIFLKALEGFLLQTHRGDEAYRFLLEKNFSSLTDISDFWEQVLHTPPAERNAAWRSRFWMIPFIGKSPFSETAPPPIPFADGEMLLPYARTILKTPKSKPLPLHVYWLRWLQYFEIDHTGTVYVSSEAEILPLETLESWLDAWLGATTDITTLRPIAALAIQHAPKDRLPRICDPFGGGGALIATLTTEYIVDKASRNTLCDAFGKPLRNLRVRMSGNRLQSEDKWGNSLVYEARAGEGGYNRTIEPAIQGLQMAIFKEKVQLLTQGIFILTHSPLAADACRLRLWLVLLRHAYYTAESGYDQLAPFPDALPNIRWGNAFLNRFALDSDIAEMLEHNAVRKGLYLSALRKFLRETEGNARREARLLVTDMQQKFKPEMKPHTADLQRLQLLQSELHEKSNPLLELAMDAAQTQRKNTHIASLQAEIAVLTASLTADSPFYAAAFEWRYAFPEILSGENAAFSGFDAIVCAPRETRLAEELPPAVYLSSRYESYAYFAKAIFYAIERSGQLLAPNGVCAAILPPDWQENTHAKNFRKWLSLRPHQLIRIGEEHLLAIFG